MGMNAYSRKDRDKSGYLLKKPASRLLSIFLIKVAILQ